jgi:hypothetical protein
MTIMMIVGTAVQAVGAIQEGNAAKDAADYNAAVSRRQAEYAQQTSAFEADLSRDRTKAIMAEQQAAYGKGGVTGEGTPLLVAVKTAQKAELDAQAIIYGGNVQAANFEAEAGLQTMLGQQQRQAGFMKAGGTLLTGIGTAGMMQSQTSSPGSTLGSGGGQPVQGLSAFA